MITHEEEIYDLNSFARKVSGWSVLALMSRMGVVVGLPELTGGRCEPRDVASQMIVISSQGCQRPQ
jgi:hypothetical protein